MTVGRLSESWRNWASHMTRKILLFATKFGVSALFVFVLVRQIEWGEISGLLATANLPLIIVAFALTILSVVLSSVKLAVLLGRPSAIGQLIRLNFIGLFFNLILPGSISGDVYRAAALRQLGASLSKGTALVFVDRLTGLGAVLVYLLIGAIWVVGHGGVPQIVGTPSFVWQGNLLLVLGVIAGIVVSVFWAKISPILVRVWQDTAQLLVAPRKLWASLGIAGIFQLLPPLMFAITLIAVDPLVVIEPFRILFVVALVTIATMVPISFQGIGIREYLYLLLLPSVDPNVLVSASLISYVIYVLCSLIGLYYFIQTDKRGSS